MINLPPYPTTGDQNWRGLTIREIQMRRVLVQTRMEIEKYRMSTAMDRVKERTPLLGGSGLLSRFAGTVSIAEYAFMAFKIVRWFVPFFKKKR